VYRDFPPFLPLQRYIFFTVCPLQEEKYNIKRRKRKKGENRKKGKKEDDVS
jgi:hypothetical protein